jgi:hypothetical protein
MDSPETGRPVPKPPVVTDEQNVGIPPVVAPRQWYYSRDGQRFGPLKEGEVHQAIVRGEIRTWDQVWTEGMAGWTAASNRFPFPPGTPPALLPAPGSAFPPPAPSEGVRYKWNNWQIAAFICWGVGAVLILIPALLMLLTGIQTDRLVYIVPPIIGVVFLGTGGTLHKIGTGRERY